MRRGRPLTLIWQETAEELYQRYRQEQNRHRRDRLQVLWLVCGGKTLTEVSQVVGVPYSTVKRWITWYRQGGLDQVLRRTPGYAATGVGSYLSDEQQTRLRRQADRGTFRTANEVQRWIKQKWSISYSRKGIYSLFGRMKITWKVPRPQAAQADVKAQAAWKKGVSTSS
jgi:transposase